MMFSNPIASYKQMDVESDVRGADPHRLIVLLFDGAESALRQAQISLVEKDYPAKSNYLMKAVEIIMNGLSASLNIQAGGDLAEKLQALYTYMISRLIHANTHNDEIAIAEVQHLLGEISSAWRELGTTLKNPDALHAEIQSPQT